MKKVLILAFAISISSGSALAWSWGDCPHSKNKVNQEGTNEKVEKTESSSKRSK